MVLKPRRLEYSTTSIRCDGIKSQIHPRFWENFNFCSDSGRSCRGNDRQFRFPLKAVKIVISYKRCFLDTFHKKEEYRKHNLQFNPLRDEAHYTLTSERKYKPTFPLCIFLFLLLTHVFYSTPLWRKSNTHEACSVNERY